MQNLDAHLFGARFFGARLIAGAFLILWTSFLGVGCASDGVDVHRDQSAPTFSTAPSRAERDLKGVEARRAQIDAAGRGADCAAIGPRAGASAWLGAWCGFRTQQWAMSAQQAKIAQRYLADRGQLRRQIEMLLLEAIALETSTREEVARAQVSRNDTSYQSSIYQNSIGMPDARAVSLATQAHQLWATSHMPMHGNLRQRDAGDLAILYATALNLGLLKDAKSSDGTPLRRAALLDIARHEYHDFRRLGALSATLRLSHELAMERGQLDRAIQFLERAFALDLDAEQQSALGEDLALFEQLGVFLGQIEALEEVERASPVSLSASKEDIEDLLLHPAGRRQLADFIAWTRASPTRTIAPLPSLMEALRGDVEVDNWHGEDWRLGFQGGQLLVEHGLVEPGKRYLRASIGAIEEMRARLPTPTLRQEFFADKRKVYMALVDAYIGLDTAQRTQANYQRSLLLANALKARGLLDLLDGHLDPALATEDRSTTRNSQQMRSLTPNSARSKRIRATHALSQLKYWSSTQRSYLTDYDEVAAKKRPLFSGLPSTVVAQIPPNTVLLEYLFMPRRSYLWVISGEGIKMRQLAGSEEIEPLVEAFLSTLSQENNSQRQRELSERLYVELIGPAQDLLKSVDRLIIAPDGKLYDLPFEMLARPTRSAKPNYMMLNQVVTYTPSSAVFERLMTREMASKSGAKSARALLIGAADLDRAAIDLLKLATDLPASGMFSLQDIFPPLPGARAELNDINTRLDAQKYDVEMRVGKMAAESWMRNADLSQYGIIHVAAHGISDARSLQIAGVQSGLKFNQPALLLSRDPEQPDDGIITLSELLSRRTAADMVVLSGCTTGRGWHTLGAGAFGLAGAILYTGSRSVVASMWSVEDADTSKLMSVFYRGIADGKTPAQALQSGQIAMSKAGMSPASWAAFRVIGGG